jgi:N-acetylmuramate 1-kinase
MHPSIIVDTAIVWASPERQSQFEQWLGAVAAAHQLNRATLRPASADASFRRYFRIDASSGRSFIIMDAPPSHENSRPFVEIAAIMRYAGLLVPEILDWHEPQGFMLLSDLGAQTMLDTLDATDTYALTGRSVSMAGSQNLVRYDQALDALIAWQLASKPQTLPPYDEALLRRELQLFPDWYVAKHRQIALDAQQQSTLDVAFDRLVAHNLASPSVYVHRDFMPRNLMSPYPYLIEQAQRHQQPQQMLGVLDFQDAVYGPITYDIASLMRDAFLSWEEDFVLEVTVRYWQKAKKEGLPLLDEWQDDFGAFYKAVEWMGLQRHLKILGIFARLTLRDGKPKYLADTPRFITYVRATCGRYAELKPLLRLVDHIEGLPPANPFLFARV